MRFIGVIPARFGSSRLPGKPLLRIAGKPLIQWVYERALQVRRLSSLWVATDDERIRECVSAFGGKVMMTRSDHGSGTDRVAEVASRLEADVFVNIQGDEPLISGSTIDSVCRVFEKEPGAQVCTASIHLQEPEEARSPHVVKVVTDINGRALYFSRSPIPFERKPPAQYRKHLGIYAYRRDVLLNLYALSPSNLELTEGLEQLRFLENGMAVHVVEVPDDSVGVDTIEDLERVRPLLENLSQPQRESQTEEEPETQRMGRKGN